MSDPSKEQIRAGVNAVLAIAEAIRELGTVPNGHLYAHVMPAGISLEAYGRVVQILKNTGLVKEEAHLLTWVGPKIEGGAP